MKRSISLVAAETRNLMLALHELATSERDGYADGVRWAIGDLATLVELGETERVRARAFDALEKRGFWRGIQPEPAAQIGGEQ